ncbi:hypothetical protein AAFF_G00216350 [Aldrovandia affinis]|uniref:Uncharacterized protein n=1 Tax=Aldrovandia affinis TaxID=143900 RepID=A0AAD7RGA5_9TELE|nr:hypothetical protein AAFF_G00216350 [Aldrovandia affinis]
MGGADEEGEEPVVVAEDSASPGDGPMLLDTWYAIKPGNTRAKIALFLAQQCSGVPGPLRPLKAKGARGGGDCTQAKRRRRSSSSSSSPSPPTAPTAPGPPPPG